jgi:hypothetical protein
MSYPQQGYPPQNPQRPVDPRAYQPRMVRPQTSIELPVTTAPTLGQYFRSDYRGVPGAKKKRWAGLIAFWVGMASIPTLFILGAALEQRAFYEVALAMSVLAGFFGLVALVAGIGRVLGFFGILFALLGNVYVISWLDTIFNPQ